MTPFIISAVLVAGVIIAIVVSLPEVMKYLEERRQTKYAYKLEKLRMQEGKEKEKE